MLAGATRRSRNQAAWEQIYRALEHGHVKNQCNNQSIMAGFTPSVQQFGRHFVDMQRRRHYADYAPDTDYRRSDVMRFIDETER